MATTSGRPDIKIIANGVTLDTWSRYSIDSNMMTPADAFSLEASNPDADATDVIGVGDLIKVEVEGYVEMIGYVDEVEYHGGVEGDFVRYTGRDLFAFLVDCSAELVSLKNQNLKTLAETLASDWVSTWAVAGGAELDEIRRAKVEPGESILDVLNRFASKQDLIIWATADGEGRIGKPDYSGAPHYQIRNYARSSPRRDENNVISYRVARNWRERYSEITAYGMTGNTKANYGNSRRSKAQALDSDVPVYRPLVVVDGDLKNLDQAQKLARREVDRRAADAVLLEYTVRGAWGLDDGGNRNLWQIDTQVDVDDEMSGETGTYYVLGRTFRGDSFGDFTDLILKPTGVWLA